jgi:uncharacterized hydrophobic protein (TIGR00271 family)
MAPMNPVTAADVARMTDALYIDGPWRGRKSTKFWTLLVLAAVIATAGVIADSTATVIGAMIVAPLMTPILGTALAVVMADRRHLLLSVGYVLGGALAVVGIAFAMGLAISTPDGFASNTQVAARISPRLIDLVAALATGTVGAFALVRSDISDTLPGVAIAISLVPPLAVVGLLLEVGDYQAATGAALLFGTNVAAIVATGTAVLLGYRVREVARSAGLGVGVLTGRTLLAVVALVVVVTIPLAAGSAAVAADQSLAAQTLPVAKRWAGASDWQVESLEAKAGAVYVVAIGPAPAPEPGALRRLMNIEGLGGAELNVELVDGGAYLCRPEAVVCTRPKPTE